MWVASSKDIGYRVTAAPPGTPRPVRFKIGGLTVCMTTVEALELAGKLADAIAELKQREQENRRTNNE